ncbi:hypothetical protein ABTZ99_13490 [Actinosynnema sp. NPDC002837]
MDDVGEVPAGLADAGRELWCSIAEEFELAPHELAVLEQAARVADQVALLDAVVARDGVLLEHPQRGPMTHPSLVELRNQRTTLARLLTALRLPDDDDQRPQRRGIRGVYRPRGARGAA